MYFINKTIHNDKLIKTFSESLRKNPPAIGTDRVCLKSVTIETSDPKHPLHIKAGEVCMIPIYSLHRDEKYYPNPNQFDPERFSDENKHKLNPGAYAPFGIGPRNCIGWILLIF